MTDMTDIKDKINISATNGLFAFIDDDNTIHIDLNWTEIFNQVESKLFQHSANTILKTNLSGGFERQPIDEMKQEFYEYVQDEVGYDLKNEAILHEANPELKAEWDKITDAMVAYMVVRKLIL